MNSIKKLNFPKIGQIILLSMAIIQSSIYLYLITQTQYTSKSFLISIYLFFTALLTLILTAISIPAKIYYNNTTIYMIVAVVGIMGRLGSMIVLNIINDSPSQQFYLTQDGYKSLMQTAVIFMALDCLLLYQKTHYYRTKKSDEQRMMLP